MFDICARRATRVRDAVLSSHYGCFQPGKRGLPITHCSCALRIPLKEYRMR